MYELLLRTETLFLGLKPLVLLAIGIPALAVGLVFWLGGSRYPAVSALDPRPMILLIAFLVMVVIGWMWQLLFFHAKPRKEQAEREHGEKGA